ncbi:3'(2'),5'-bisphosphate nucleotidase CysQ [Paracidovorax anthurii]|uniref:3'(2'),5'-bisphosphate nucleotidase CysQ n=1 Tax=Paracidovorax anthurii TaxID=78229 RepID=A0A328YTF0_9BURK|nr:3'(2'),5'-bisphosphate nucleotidase CysQ [Paracidovorax anthurii]RAR77268.1 3'(2'),5'-bisphosphate nucleotidase [Paracidovorax anthurii]
MSVADRSLAGLLDAVAGIARRAGEAVMEVYGDADACVSWKDDGSPVTQADLRSQAVIVDALRQLTPGVPIVAEEDEAQACCALVADAPFWLVDPLDGTREFLRRNGEFTVNIALVSGARAVLGVVFAPALDQLFAGSLEGPAFLEDARGRCPIACRAIPQEGITVVGSRSHGDAGALEDFLRGYRVAAVRHAGSSLKLCLVAAGQADLYPRLGPTMEWDIAAGHAVLAAAGGRVTDLSGVPLIYGKPDFRNPHFLACSSGVQRAGAH